MHLDRNLIEVILYSKASFLNPKINLIYYLQEIVEYIIKDYNIIKKWKDKSRSKEIIETYMLDIMY